MDCYRRIIDAFEGKCGKVAENAMKHFRHFAEYCQNEVNAELTLKQIDAICETT